MTTIQELRTIRDAEFGVDGTGVKLADLVGSEKQIAWAMKIRKAKIEHLTRTIASEESAATTHPREDRRKEEAASAQSHRRILAFIAGQASAKWWIDYRDANFADDITL